MFGADPIDAGSIWLEGKRLSITSPASAIAAGIGYLTEDRKRNGLAMTLDIAQNITLSNLPTTASWINLGKEEQIALRARDRLNIRTPSVHRKVAVLSGGNQQKVIVARWLETQARVLFFDEPSRGIDVNAKAELFELIGALANEGRAIVMISSYLPELINMCDRLVVLREGRIAGELERSQFTEERIMALATGASEGGDAMKDATQSTNEVIANEASVPAELPVGQRTVLQKVRERLGDFIAQAAAAGALIMVFIFFSFYTSVFLTTDNFINIVEQNAVTAIIALGMTFVIITAGIDLSVGSTAAMTGVVGVELVAHGWHWPPALLVAILAGGVVGLVNGVLISVARLNPFITTLGMMTVVRGLTDVYTDAKVVYAANTDELGPNNFGVIGLGKVAGIPVALIILVVLAVIAYVLLSHTRLGRYTYAIGSNQEAARLSGIPVRRYLLAVYVILGLLTGLRAWSPFRA